MKSIYRYIVKNECRSSDLVIATIISAEGSAPQKPGSSALFSSKRLEYGTIGGGVLEETVKKTALKSASDRWSGIFYFNLAGNTEDHESAICGGRVTVIIDAEACADKLFIRKLEELFRKNVPFIVASLIYSDIRNKIRIEKYIITPDFTGNIPPQYMMAIQKEASSLFNSNHEFPFSSFTLDTLPGGKTVTAVLEAVFPPLRLIIAGAGHVGKALSHLGKFLDFEVTVIDDRPEFANKENLPDADEIIVDNIGKALENIKKDDKTYIVIVTRGHASDAEALKSCIRSNAAYIGMIGSKTKTEKMHMEFIGKDWATEEEWAKIYAPIGVKINSRSVEEIAVSIAAELVLTRNRKN